jgi:hypothetical protein
LCAGSMAEGGEEKYAMLLDRRHFIERYGGSKRILPRHFYPATNW